jgi:hypothetical protein
MFLVKSLTNRSNSKGTKLGKQLRDEVMKSIFVLHTCPLVLLLLFF